MADNHSPYDDNADETHAPQAQSGSGGLNQAEQNPEQPSWTEDDEADAFAAFIDRMPQKEVAATGGEGGADESSEKKETDTADSDKKDDTVGKGFTGNAKSKVSAAKNKGKGLAAKIRNSKKMIIIGASGTVVGVIAAIVALFILASSLKLPNLSENIIGYQFASLSLAFSRAGDKITDESLAKVTARAFKDTKAGQAIMKVINNTHDKATGLKDGTITKVKNIPGVSKYLELNDRFNPSQVEKNLKSFGINFSNDTRGRPVVTLSGKAAESLGIGEQSFITEPPTGFGRFIPGYSSFLKAKSNNALWNDETVKKALQNAFEQGEGLTNVGTVTRSFAMNNILQRIGINRAGLFIANYKNASDAKKQAQALDKELNSTTSPKPPLVPDKGPSADAAQEATDKQTAAEEAAADDPTGDKTLALEGTDSTGIPDEVPEALSKAASHGTVSAISRFVAGPLFNAMYLACVFNEGAVPQDNAKIMDANNDANERAATKFFAVADQLKRGPVDNSQITEFDNAIAAMSNKVGSDEAFSIPLLRSSGTSYDTSTELSAQSTTYGFQPPQKAINNSAFWTFMTAVAPYCDQISSAWTAGGVAIANLGLLLATLPTGEEGGAAEAGAAAVTQSVFKTFMGKITKTLAVKFSENFGKKAGYKLAAKNVVSKSYKLLKSVIVNGAVVIGTESLGAMMAAAHGVGLNHTGYETGNTYINQIDAGGNALAQEQMRTMLFGRPLLKAEACQNQAVGLNYEKGTLTNQSAYQRYLATTNPRSLLAHVAISVHDNLGSSLSKPISNLAAIITQATNPFGWLSSVFGYRAFAAAAANCDAGTAFYGNVQFGWSAYENNLTDSSPSYNPDENLAILAESGKAGPIADKYASCFGYKYAPGDSNNDDLLPDPTATVGFLLNGDDSHGPAIIRDEAGNVIDDDSAKCSPEYLGPNSKDTDLARDDSPDSPLGNDLIFRWRLAMKYEKVQEQLIDIQNATTAEKQ